MRRRQLTNQEKQDILTKYGRICFVDNRPLEENEEPEFHHIIPFSENGDTDAANIAPVCKEHHRRMRILSIHEFRDKIKLEEFFEHPEPRRLDDLLEKVLGKNNWGNKVQVVDNSNSVTVWFGNENKNDFQVYTCPATQMRFFYGLVPVEYIRNDTSLQPRPLEPKRLWELYSHLMRHTQLAAAVCRLSDGLILLFDGQHKTATQIWLKRKYVEVKVYLDADENRLRETNLVAHEKLRQMQFYTTTLIRKYSDVFHNDWEEYMEQGGTKSEIGFVNFLVHQKLQTRNEAKKKLQSAIIADILDSPDNRINNYLSERNRTRACPLTLSALDKTFFKEFIVTPPLDIQFESEKDFRDEEKANLIRILNIFVEETLDNKWNPEVKNDVHKKAERIYATGCMRAWVPRIRDVIAAVIRLFDQNEREKILFRHLSDEDFNQIRERIKRAFTHKIWTDQSEQAEATLRLNNASIIKEFMDEQGFTVNWILGGEE